MMKKLIPIIIAILFFSCKSTMTFPSQGLFTSGGKNHQYQLLLNPDKTFEFAFTYIEGKSGCNGNWEIEDDYVILKCYEPENILETIQGGYLNDRELKLKIINSNKIIFRNVVMQHRE